MCIWGEGQGKVIDAVRAAGGPADWWRAGTEEQPFFLLSLARRRRARVGLSEGVVIVVIEEPG